MVFNNLSNNFDERHYVYDGQSDLNDWTCVHPMCTRLTQRPKFTRGRITHESGQQRRVEE